MKRLILILFNWCFVCSFTLHAQAFKFDKTTLEAVNISMSIEKLIDKDVVKVIKDSAITELMNPLSPKQKELISGMALLK